MSEVVIYTRDWCGYCTAAKSLLKKKGVEFEEKNATNDAALKKEMIAKAKGGTTFPQVFINGNHVGGCDELFALDSDGKLDALLA